MKNQRATEIKVGLTVLVGVLLFIWLLSWTKNFSVASSDVIVKVLFNNVSGLEIGNDVTVNGVKKGHVKDFEIQKTSVLVTLSVNNDVQLKEDATFSLEMTDLMGGRKIEINPGYSDKPLDTEATHQGNYRTDIAGLITVIGEMRSDFESIVKETNTALEGMNKILADDVFIDDLKSSVSNLNRVSMKLELVLNENRNNLKEIADNTKVITSETKEFMTSNRESIENSIASLNVVLHSLDSLLTKLNMITDQTVSSKNNLGKILYDDSLYIGLTESIKRLQELSKVILDQLNTDGIKVDADIF